jgi:hypothetical protein
MPNPKKTKPNHVGHLTKLTAEFLAAVHEVINYERNALEAVLFWELADPMTHSYPSDHPLAPEYEVQMCLLVRCM